MQIHLAILPLILLITSAAIAAPTIELELATERGLQITAPQEWLQLLTRLGVQNVQIRGARPGDAPAVTNRGTAERPQYHVVGILTAREQLRLPNGTFSRSDSKQMKDYFDRLTADGEERLTATERHFGLTDKEFSAVLADLSQPLEFDTKGRAPQVAIERLQAKLKNKIDIDAVADRTLNEAAPVADELKRISAGTALAMMLRSYGLVFRPEKARGQAIVYRVAAGGSPAAISTGGPPVATEDDKAGKMSQTTRKNWPVGWDVDRAPGEIAPSLFEKLSAQIDGFTLEETLNAIGPRMKVPYYLDHRLLSAKKIDPKVVTIRVERAQMSYMRLLERVLSQSRLGAQVRADEAGLLFLWISQ